MRTPIHLYLRVRMTLTLIAVFLAYLPVLSQNSVKFGNSYINLSKKSVGGTVQPGDTLEIRTNYYFPGGYNGGNIYYIRYVDNVPTNTVYVDDSLRLITNEGLLYKRWTNAANDDAATYEPSPAAGMYNVRINIGTGVTAPLNTSATNPNGAGSLRPGTDKPKVAGGLLITTAFKVKVTGNVGDVITLGAGQLLYKKIKSTSAVDTIVNAIQYQILISNNDPICSNAIGKNFVAEAGGTFDSGSVQNRSYGPTFLIPNYTYRNLTSANQINDGYYTIVNNLSPYASTFRNAEKRPSCLTPAGGPPPNPLACDNRMFSGYWDIIGDHTGSSGPLGNNPVAAGSKGGYMLVVNADYATSEAYRQTITGLCPNTSYEFSLWVKNVCTNCGLDSNGTATYKPGVMPNLTFAVDGLDRYSSGTIDTFGWMKKGFLFKTGASQNSVTISIRNNASGGGGNDWAIDDIALVTCNPNLNLVPSGNAQVCYGNQVDVASTVTAFFDNYVNYKWERSTDGGATWTVAGSGVGSPGSSGGSYQYTASLPSFLADSSHNLNQYRFTVASTAANLASSTCSFTANTVIVVMTNNCLVPLKTGIVGFSGKLSNDRAVLTWKIQDEEPGIIYNIEKSYDGVNFTTVGTIPGKYSTTKEGSYNFHDPEPVKGNVYYRIRMIEGKNENYSKLILLSTGLEFEIKSVINPFNTKVDIQLTTPREGWVECIIADTYGKIVHRSRRMASAGLSSITIDNLGGLSAGTYFLRVELNGKSINKKIVKFNR
jgi:hypothetical protein